MSESILWFEEIGKNDVPKVGGKGANLGEMTQAGFPIPPGFCVTAQAYFKFLDTSGLKNEIIAKIDSINVEDTSELENTTKEVRDLIMRKDMGYELKTQVIKSYSLLVSKRLGNFEKGNRTYVAVRSSATAEDLPTASFAGQQDTYLNIMGEQQLINSIKRCWASLFTARATYYRKKQGFSTRQVGISVVVQKMVNSEAAGVMFTASPTGDRNKVIIEAAYGLGDSVVSGSLTPDTYTISKENLEILDKKISKQKWLNTKYEGETVKSDVKEEMQEEQKIDDESICELARIGKEIEKHYNRPQDIEWAYEKDEMFIVQSRAITTLSLAKKQIDEKIKDNAKTISVGLAASPGIITGVARIIPSVHDISRVKGGEILVTTMTTPDWVPIMRKSSAIITNEGGSTCHAAIVSRELGIPCVVGTQDGTEKIEDGSIVTVDGYNGKVYLGEVKIEKPVNTEEKTKVIEDIEVEKLAKILEGTKEAQKIEEKIETLQNEKKTEFISEEKDHLEALMSHLAIKVKVNVALPDVAEKAAATNADGVGLLRAEHMITATGIHPAYYIREGKRKELVKVIKEGIRQVVEKFKGKPVWYRTFDARTDEFRNLKGGKDEPHEDNPMLGWHGIRRSLDQPELIKAEFEAIKELVREGYKNIGVMLPFVIDAKEVAKAKGHARSAGLNPRIDVQFGVMIETPSSIWIIDELIKEGIDFISFGTNDLTQLTLGLDRNNERIQKYFNAKHPAILRSLEYVIKKCNENNVTTSICGQAGSDKEMVLKLIGMGISSVSANIDAVEKIKEIALREEKRLLLAKFGRN